MEKVQVINPFTNYGFKKIFGDINTVELRLKSRNLLFNLHSLEGMTFYSCHTSHFSDFNRAFALEQSGA